MEECSQENNLLEKLDLKPEQEQAVRDLLSGKYMLGVLPRGSEKVGFFKL